MIDKGSLVLLLLALAIHEIRGQGMSSCEISDDFINNAWMYEYDDQFRVLNLRFTNTTMMRYRGETLLETLLCLRTDSASPSELMLAENPSGQKRCFQFISFNTEERVVFGMRETDGTGATTGSDCLRKFQLGGSAHTENLKIMPRWDPNSLSENDGFSFALNNGQCSGSFPLAFDRGVDSTDPTSLFTKELGASVNTGMPNQYQCENVTTSFCTRQGNVIDCNMCELDPANITSGGYYNPSRQNWKCLGNMQANSVDLVGKANFQIFAIEDLTRRLHFACARFREVDNPAALPGDPRCLEFSLDLTDEFAPVCRIENQDGTEVTTSQAYRDGNKGYMSFRFCAEDCMRGRCVNEQPNQCAQERESFDCNDCQINFDGPLCDQEKLECDSNPCQNEGNCFEKGAEEGYDCTCPDGFSGVNCEMQTCIFPDSWKSVNYFYRYNGARVDMTDVSTVDFEDNQYVNIAGVKWDCERQTESSGVYTFTMKRDGNTNERTCLEVVPHVSTTAGKRDFLFIRLKNKGDTGNAIQNPSTCGFLVMDSYNVLIKPNAPNEIEVPLAAGTYQVESTFGNATCGMNDDDSQASITQGTNIINLGPSCKPTVSNLLPNGQSVLNVVTKWDPQIWGDVNSGSNGQAMLLRINNLLAGDNGPTYYCARYYQETNSNPVIDLSINIKSQFAPECGPTTNAQQSDASHVYLKLTSNKCHLQGNPCSPGTCEDTVNQAINCRCPPGTTGTTQCSEINECDANPCFANGTMRCVDGSNTFTCECQGGWSGNLCDAEDTCYSNGCVNGDCIEDTTQTRKYRCECNDGWDGDFCNNDIDECASNPCQHGGTCNQDDENNQLKLDHYRCICSTGYSGTNCDQVRDNCDPNPCMHGGTCVNYPENERDDQGYYCICLKEWMWKNCEERNNCYFDPLCHPDNTASCQDLMGEQICHCKEGFLGGPTADNHYNGDCSQVDTSNKCYSSPCKNGAECMYNATSEDYHCECTMEYTGETCIEKALTCADNPCHNREICTSNSTTAYHCLCPEGETCEDEDFGTVEIVLIVLLAVLVIGCLILAIWAICANRCGSCGPKGGCCP